MALESKSHLPRLSEKSGLLLSAMQSGAFVAPFLHRETCFLAPIPRICTHAATESRRAPITASANKMRRRNLAPTVINRQARFRYEFLETYECGIELVGTEIKSVREGNINLRDGYARVKDGQLYLHNVHIAPWNFATGYFNHDPLRIRRLFLHKREIRKLDGKQAETGLTLIPSKSYFSDNGYLKIEIVLAKGKKLHDRREVIKKRDDARDMRRVIKATLSA